jgi:MATE family multidrug resistance protein
MADGQQPFAGSRLTRFEPGSIGELLTIAWPLIIASAANMLMVLGDRAVLAHYSTAAFQSVSAAIPWWGTIYFSLLNIALIAGVFVGRYNGEGNFQKIGPAVWQMLWFSLALVIPMIAIAIWVAPLLLAKNLENFGLSYLRILLISIPIPVATFGALASFFSGRGKTRLITAVALVTNLLNIFFDVLLVFGWGPIPKLGPKGAALGTVLAESIGLLLLAKFFFTRENWKIFGIGHRKFNGKLFGECLKIGLPNAIDGFITSALWSWTIQIAAIYLDSDSFSLLIIGQTIYWTLFFFIEGIGEGVGTVCSNAYGSRNWGMVRRNIRSWFFLSLIGGAIAFVLLVLYPYPFVALLLPSDSSESLFSQLRPFLVIFWFLLLFSGYSFNYRMMLTSFGDTKFTMVGSILCDTFCSVIPSYFAVRYLQNALLVCWGWVFSTLLFSSICFLRFRHIFQRTQEMAAPSPTIDGSP